MSNSNIQTKQWYNDIAYSSIQEFRDRSIFLKNGFPTFQSKPSSHSYQNCRYHKLPEQLKCNPQAWKIHTKIQAHTLVSYDLGQQTGINRVGQNNEQKSRWQAHANWKTVVWHSDRLKHQWHFQMGNFYQGGMYRYVRDQNEQFMPDFKFYCQLQRYKIANKFLADLGITKKLSKHLTIFSSIRLSRPQGIMKQHKYGFQYTRQYFKLDYTYQNSSSHTQNNNQRHDFKLNTHKLLGRLNLMMHYKTKDEISLLGELCNSDALKLAMTFDKSQDTKFACQAVVNSYTKAQQIQLKKQGKKQLSTFSLCDISIGAQTTITSAVLKKFQNIQQCKIGLKLSSLDEQDQQADNLDSSGMKIMGKIQVVHGKMCGLLGLDYSLLDDRGSKILFGLTINQ